MKLPDIDTIKTAEQARELALDWQDWQADHALSYSELAEYEYYFVDLAKKFDLYAEFNENGII